VQSLNRERGSVLLSRRQSANRIEKIFAVKSHRFTNSLSFEQLGHNRTTNQRRRAAVRQKARGFDAALTHAQRQTQAIAADRIRLVGNRVCIGQFARVARMSEMVFEGIRVRQDQFVSKKATEAQRHRERTSVGDER